MGGTEANAKGTERELLDAKITKTDALSTTIEEFA